MKCIGDVESLGVTVKDFGVNWTILGHSERRAYVLVVSITWFTGCLYYICVLIQV